MVVLLVAASAWAARAELQVDASHLTVGQSVGLTITIVDGVPTSVPTLSPPDGLQIEYRGREQQLTMVNSKVSHSVRLRYGLDALKEGRYEIGPIDVEVGQDHLKTGVIDVEVGGASAEPGAAAEDPIRAKAGFDRTEAWEGQVVLYQFQVQSRIPLLQVQWTPPLLDGFIPPRDGDAPHREYQIEDPTGTLYVVEDTKPLVVTGTGDKSQQSAVAQVEIVDDKGPQRSPFDPFGMLARTKRVVRQGEPSPLTVKPLPPPPPGFSGLVGDFEIDGKVDRPTVPVGGSITWTVDVRGTGTLEAFALPPTPAFDGARLYEGSPLVSAQVDGNQYVASGQYSRVIVPVREGKLAVPPLDIITFSPTKGAYETHRLEAGDITVTKGDGNTAAVESYAQRPGEIPETPVDDIRPPITAGLDHVWRLGPALPWLLVGAALPGLGAAGVEARRWWARRPKKAVAPRVVTARERLKSLPADPKARLAALDGALREALARRAGVDVGALDREAAIHGLPAKVREKVAGAAKALDRARFAEAGLSPDVEQLVTDAVLALEGK